MDEKTSATITLITGGQRSGKSRFALKLAAEFSVNPVYLATARKWDEEFEERIERHRSDRGDHWRTIEEEKYISRFDLKGETVVLDCVTLWLTNIFYDNSNDLEKSLQQAKEEWVGFVSSSFRLFVVSNEVGMGIIPESPIARKFADLQGWMNQFIASQSDEVILMVSGLPVKVK